MDGRGTFGFSLKENTANKRFLNRQVKDAVSSFRVLTKKRKYAKQFVMRYKPNIRILKSLLLMMEVVIGPPKFSMNCQRKIHDFGLYT